MVPEEGGGSITARDAADLVARTDPSLRPAQDRRRLSIVPPDLLLDLGRSARFGPMRLSRYVDAVDVTQQLQFAAVTVELPDGTDFIAFRGTDYTIVGWKEDFLMSVGVVLAQERAASYVRGHLETSTRPLRLGGHSKGGNMAVYAAVSVPSVPLQDRILEIWDNDGPGMSPEFVDAESRARLEGRVHKIVPEFAIIGMLFEAEDSVRVVASSASGMMQHEILTWQVGATDIREVPEIDRRARAIGDVIDRWLEGAREAERREFIDAFFEALSVGGAELIVDVGRTEFGSVESLILALRRSRRRTRRLGWRGVRSALESLARIDYVAVLRERRAIRAVILVALGAYFILVPPLATQVLASFALLLITLYVAWRSIRFVIRFGRRHELSWVHWAACLLAVPVVVLGLMQIEAFVTPSNIVLGAALLANAWDSGDRAFRSVRSGRRRRVRTVLLSASAVLSLMLAVVALSTASLVLPVFVLVTGQYLFVVGLLELFFEVKVRADRARHELLTVALATEIASTDPRG